MKRIIAAAVFFMLITPLFSIELEIEYVDGYIDVKEGSNWEELAPGDIVTDRDTLRLDEGSLATLSFPGGTLTLTRAGIYPVSSLIRSQTSSKGVGSLVSMKLKRLVAEPEQTRSAVGGVRGAKQDDEVEWMSSEAAELITTGKKYLAEDSFEDALDAFAEAYDYAEIEEEPEILYYTAYAHYILGNIPDAIMSVEEIELPEDAYFASDYYILKGQILLDSFAFEDAAHWLENVPEDLTENDTQTFQAVNLLLATCMASLGNQRSADEYLEDVIKADPKSAYADVARKTK